MPIEGNITMVIQDKKSVRAVVKAMYMIVHDFCFVMFPFLCEQNC